MGTTSDKLTYLNTTKGKIKDVINMTGANITSDTTFRNYATKLYDGYISVLKDKNTLLDNMPKGTSTGTITDAADLPVYEDKMSKESKQETTTGVQLANINDYSTTKLGVNVSCINNEFVLNGTTNSAGSLIGSPSSSGILYMATLPPGTYTFSFKKISGSLTYSSGLSAFYIRNSSGQNLGSVSIFSVTENVKGIFTLTEETDVYLQYYVNTSNWKFANYDFQIMILSGDYTSSIIPDFEPYTGGQASPNSNYPQEIKTVKGYNNLLNWELPYNVQSEGNIILNNVPQIEIGKSYCFVGKCSDGTILSYANCSCVWYTGSTQILNKAPNNTFEGIDVSNATGFYIYVTSAIVGKTISEFMLVEGTYNNIKNLPYVPYGTNWIYKKIVGKNLFDKDNNLSNGYLKVDGTIQNASNYKVSDYIYIGNLEKFTISGNAGTSEVNCFYDENKVFILANGIGTNTSKTFNVPSNAKYIRCTINISNLDQYQLEKDSIVTSYEPYKESIVTIPLNNNEISGIGDYKDELIVDKNGKCWLNKVTGKVVLDGINNLFEATGSTNTTGIYRFRTANIGSKLSSSAEEVLPILCNKLIAKSLNDTYLKIQGICALNSNNKLLVFINEISQYTLEQANAWLVNNNIEIYYPLATPQLIDLNYTVDLTLFEGVNNISNSEDMDMEIKYIKESYE